MATYKEIRGTQIEAVATDPSNPVQGQVWYNTTDNVLKGQIVTGAGTWATGGTMNSARHSSGGAGTQDAALVFGGEGPPGLKAITEEWNGASWTEVADLNTASSRRGSAGTTSNALAIGGISPSGNISATEEWSGSSTTTKTISTD